MDILIGITDKIILIKKLKNVVIKVQKNQTLCMRDNQKLI